MEPLAQTVSGASLHATPLDPRRRLQRGKALKPNTTMTGTINPDSSSGNEGSKLNALQKFWLARFWCDAVRGRYR